jgi:hypothetical protein
MTKNNQFVVHFVRFFNGKQMFCDPIKYPYSFESQYKIVSAYLFILISDALG